MKNKYPQSISLLLSLAVLASGLAAQEKNATNVEDSKFIEKVQLRSEVFNNTRTIRILLPPDYHDEQSKQRRYPVLYLNDGVMVFHAFDLEKATHGLINSKAIEPIVIVGIDNGGSTDKSTRPDFDRPFEFLPYPDVGFAPDVVYKADPAAPAGSKYPDFMDEVRHLVESKYRIRKGASNTGIGGYSYGGVAALFTAMNHPDIYGRLMLESTPLWIGEDLRLIGDASKVKKWPSLVYLGLGSAESPNAAVNHKGRELHDLLMGYLTSSSSKPRVSFRMAEGAKHQPSFWAKRFPDALKVLFGE